MGDEEAEEERELDEQAANKLALAKQQEQERRERKMQS